MQHLIGGETAEHPGLMPEDDYDLAGFAVGVCDRKDLITGENLKDGDVLDRYGIYRSVTCNGFSLVRKVFDMSKESLNTYYDELRKNTWRSITCSDKNLCKSIKECERMLELQLKHAAISQVVDSMRIFHVCFQKECKQL